jgi:hypothetical protein
MRPARLVGVCAGACAPSPRRRQSPDAPSRIQAALSPPITLLYTRFDTPPAARRVPLRGTSEAKPGDSWRVSLPLTGQQRHLSTETLDGAFASSFEDLYAVFSLPDYTKQRPLCGQCHTDRQVHGPSGPLPATWVEPVGLFPGYFLFSVWRLWYGEAFASP